MIYNASTRLTDLLENEQAVSVLDKYLPGLRKMAGASPQAGQLSVEQLVRYTKHPKAEELIAAIGAALNELNTPENAISPSERKLIEFFKNIDEEEKKRPAPKACHFQDKIRPGKPWLDTFGRRIQAHGGAVYYENGSYYWYGENKEYTDGKNGIWTWGIKIYSSADLKNWTDLGYLIPPVLDDPNSALFPTKRVDRPHILKCEKTGKYVCWIKLSGAEAAFSIWQADRLTGPYEQVENIYNPGGHKAGDFDMVSDPATGDGYIYFDADHSCMLCMKLADDYLSAEEEVCRNYPDLKPPFTREAPALFEHMGKKYMLTSGMTGYVPNRSDSAVSQSWDGLFESLGDPHVGDASCASLNSQISKIFKIAGTDRFIAMADRWLPDTPVDARLADIFTRVVAGTWDPETYKSTDAERQEMYAANKLDKADTSVAEYVWLPVEWDGERPVIRWTDEWDPEV